MLHQLYHRVFKLPTILLLIASVYLIGFVSHALFIQKAIYGDGIFYFSWLRSAVVDQNIDFTNEYAYFHATQPKTVSGMFGNKYSIGPAILWAPSYLTMHTLLRGDGLSLPYQLTVGITSVLFALFGLVILIRLIKMPSGVVGLTLILTACATNLVFYGSVDPANSHALSFTVGVLLIAFLQQSKKQWLIIGILLGIIASIRLQDTVYGILLIPHWKTIRIRPLVMGTFIAFLPQLIAWQSLYGTLLNPYLTGGEHFDFIHPNIPGVLFSLENGLFLWTPMFAVGIFGLILSWNIYWSYVAVFVAELYIVASWETWWQGASVSGRMFVSTIPLVAIGLSIIIRNIYSIIIIRKYLFLLAGTLFFITMMEIVLYLLIH